MKETIKGKKSVWIILFGWVLLLWGIYLMFFIDTYFKKPFFSPIEYNKLSDLEAGIKEVEARRALFL